MITQRNRLPDSFILQRPIIAARQLEENKWKVTREYNVVIRMVSRSSWKNSVAIPMVHPSDMPRSGKLGTIRLSDIRNQSHPVR